MKWLTEIQDKAAKDVERITARLAELDVERKQLMKMRDAFRALVGHTSAHETGEPKDNIKDTARKILQEAGAPLALKDIYRRMLEKGTSFSGNAPKMSIYAALSRNKDVFKHTQDKRWELKTEQHFNELNV